FITFFFSIIIRPPTSTLFPYTTLFRSLRISMDTRPRENILLLFFASKQDILQEVSCVRKAASRAGGFGAGARAGGSTEPFGTRGDRKSTRLNSSHVSISYAVFCLKKKK